MARTYAVLAVCFAGVLGIAACGCPRCPIDSTDGVGVSVLSQPSAAERGAIAATLGLLIVQAGPESAEVRAIDAALNQRQLMIGWFHNAADSVTVRGYALMKDGRVALDHKFVRAATADAAYLADPRVWPSIPYLYAAGHRLAAGGTWDDSVVAAQGFAVELADTIELGGANSALPPGTDTVALTEALRRWRSSY